MSSYEFGTKLFYELCHFHKKNLDYYPDLSPFNVEYEIKTKNINLSLVPVFLDCVGMLNLPTNP